MSFMVQMKDNNNQKEYIVLNNYDASHAIMTKNSIHNTGAIVYLHVAKKCDRFLDQPVRPPLEVDNFFQKIPAWTKQFH